MNKKINPFIVLQSSLPAILVFILVDTLAEYVICKFSGIAVIEYFEGSLNKTFTFKFHAINLLVFSIEMFLVMLFYGLVKFRYDTTFKAVSVTSLFFIFFVLLFLIQMINLGIYPLNVGMVFIFTTIAAFPIAVYTGAIVYNKLVSA